MKTKSELRLEIGVFAIRDPLEDSGTYEIVEYDDDCYDLWFSGRTMRGPWRLQRVGRSWSLAPGPTA